MNDDTTGASPYHERESCSIEERIRLAIKAGGYTMLTTRQYQIGERWFDEITVEIQGKRFIGTSEIRFGGTESEARTPLETAEAIALGRALGFAGFGSGGESSAIESVGSGHPTTVTHPPPEGSTGSLAPTDAQRKKAHLEARRIGEAKARAYLNTAFGVTTTSELTRRQMSALIDWLTHQPSLPADDEPATPGPEHP